MALDDQRKEEIEEETKETIEDKTKESWDELVSEPSGPREVKFKADQEERDEEFHSQEGKEEGDDQEEEEDEASEGSIPLKPSESKKVTTAKGRIMWGMGSWAQVPSIQV